MRSRFTKEYCGVYRPQIFPSCVYGWLMSSMRNQMVSWIKKLVVVTSLPLYPGLYLPSPLQEALQVSEQLYRLFSLAHE